MTPFDNSQTKKEGVSRTYKGKDGYAAMAGNLGQEGYCLKLELRAGSQHCQKGTPEFLQRVLGRARQLTAAPAPAAASGQWQRRHREHRGGRGPQRALRAGPSHYLIKWNPRKESPEYWLAYPEEYGDWQEPRPSMRIALSDVRETRTHDGYDYDLRRVMRVIERSVDKHGQKLLVPEIEFEGWWTSLEFDAETIIAVYQRRRITF